VSIGESWFFLVGYHVILLDVVIWIICKLIRSYYWMWLYWVAQLMFLGVSVGEFAITLIWVTDVLGVVIIKSILIIIILLTALHIIHLLLTVTVSARVAVFVVIHWSLLLALHLLHKLRFVKPTDMVIWLHQFAIWHSDLFTANNLF